MSASDKPDLPQGAAGLKGVVQSTPLEPRAAVGDPTWQRRYERVAALSGQVAYEYCSAMHRILWGSSLKHVLGYAAEDVAGTVEEWADWIHPDERAETVRLLAEAERTNQDYNCEYRVRHGNGTYVWIRDRGYFVPEPSLPGGSLMIGIMQDVSDRRRADDALRLDEQRLDALLTLSQMADASLQEITDFALEEGVRLTHSTIGYLAFMNEDESVLTMHSWSQAAMAECAIHDRRRVYPVKSTGLWGEAVRQRRPVITNDYQAPAAAKKGLPEGHVPVYRHMNIPVFETDRIVAVAGVGNKATDYDEADVRQLRLLMEGMWRLVQRVRAAQELRDSEARYRGVVENSLVGIASASEDRFLYANQTLLRMLGCGSFGELAARPISQYLTPASQAYWEYYFQARASGNAVPLEYEVEAVQTDGARRVLRVCTSSVVLNDRTCELSAFLDVTDQRRAERERLDIERRLLDAQKLESLGVLAGGIAHDFNNLLMAVLGNLDMALSDTPASSPAYASIRHAMQSSRRATDLTRELLAYSGHGHFVFCRLDLNDVVHENAELLRSSVLRTTALTLNLATAKVWIEADPGQVQQIVMNLITNASEAIGERPGVVTLRTAHVDLGEEQLRQSRMEERLEPGRFACLEVTDTGCGMDEETLERLFDPFFTTKATGRGLGMSAVLGIMRGHRGAIVIDSVPGRGTTVRVFFPAGAAGTAPEAGSEAPTQAAGAPQFSGSVLVVDDDDAVRHLCVTYLHRLGFEPLAAADGEQALMLFRRCAGDVRLVLLDLTMPHMDGVATYRELKRLRPDVRVIMCSGYSEREAARRFHDEGLERFLQKPYELRQLRSTIEHVLREPPA